MKSAHRIALALALLCPAAALAQGNGSVVWDTPGLEGNACHDDTDAFAYIGTQSASPGSIRIWAEWTGVPLTAGSPQNVWASGTGTIKLQVQQWTYPNAWFYPQNQTIVVAAVKDPYIPSIWVANNKVMPFTYANFIRRTDPQQGHASGASPLTRHVFWDGALIPGVPGSGTLTWYWDCGLKLVSVYGTEHTQGFGPTNAYKGLCADVANAITF